jgi:3-deoxy-7-phosphoheptulonate synthase
MSSSDVSPIPDAEKMAEYISDRRVIGVCIVNVSVPSVDYIYILQYDPLVQPALLRHEITSSLASQKTITMARYNAARILAGLDDRLAVVVGPCSIHSTEQALEYARLLKSKIPEWPNLLIIMRAYLYVAFLFCGLFS